MNRLISLCTFALASVLVSACGSADSPIAPTVTSVVGTWNLTSVDGKPLPFLLQASDPKQEMLSRQYVFSSSGAYTLSYVIKDTELDGTSSTATASAAGSYTLSANTVTLTSQSDGSVVSAQVTPTTMTILAGATLVFAKQ
ncbi:MAG: lipocalin family protein [bacterium]